MIDSGDLSVSYLTDELLHFPIPVASRWKPCVGVNGPLSHLFRLWSEWGMASCYTSDRLQKYL